MSDPIHYAPNFPIFDWDTFENWLTEHKSKTTKQAKAISTRERHLLFTADPKCRLMQYVIKTGQNAGAWVKGRKTAMLNNKGGHVGATLRDRLSKVFKRDYLTSQERAELFKELFGDDAESKRKQAINKRLIVSSRIADKIVWHMSDVEPPNSVKQVRSLKSRHEMIDGLRGKYSNQVCGATNDCRSDDAFKCAEYHAEHSQILRLICEVRNDADLVAAQKELRLLRDEKIITFRNGAWYDKQSLEVAFPPTQTEVAKIEKTAAKLNRIQDINFEEFYGFYQKGELLCEHGLESFECEECSFHAPFMSRFNTSEAVARKLCDQCEKVELQIAEEKKREKQNQERAAQIEFEKLDKQIEQAWEDAKFKREEEQANKAREQAKIEAQRKTKEDEAQILQLMAKYRGEVASKLQPIVDAKFPEYRELIMRSACDSVLQNGSIRSNKFIDALNAELRDSEGQISGQGARIFAAIRDSKVVKFGS